MLKRISVLSSLSNAWNIEQKNRTCSMKMAFRSGVNKWNLSKCRWRNPSRTILVDQCNGTLLQHAGHRTIRRPLNRVNLLMWFVVMYFLKKKLNQGEICLSLKTWLTRQTRHRAQRVNIQFFRWWWTSSCGQEFEPNQSSDDLQVEPNVCEPTHFTGVMVDMPLFRFLW